MLSPEQLIDHAAHVAEILPLALLAWKFYRRFTRFLDVMIDFPPHRHTNGDILYPRDFSPGRIERRHSEEP